jgi:hypothetical protein
MPHHRISSGATLILLFLLECAVAAGEERITQDEARQLAVEALKAKMLNGPTVQLSPISYVKDFYTFEATWPNPDGSPNLGSFAVNPWTGDVWQVVVCKYITSPAIQKIQKSIRDRFHYPRKEYKELRARKPAC